MLSSSKRPRAPSAAALRVLYQLAYITSGAALGVGVLCAEERRRRCKLVQKVADNARRLHSNPRYCRNTSLDQIDWTDDSTANFILTRAALKNSSGVRAAGLPSVVDESYERLINHDGPRDVKKRRTKYDRLRDDERARQDSTQTSAINAKSSDYIRIPGLRKEGKSFGSLRTRPPGGQESAVSGYPTSSPGSLNALAAKSAPLRNLHRMRQRRSEDHTKAIVSDWQKSRNLDQFTAEYRKAIDQWRNDDQSATASRLSLAAVKTYLKANKIALAREILQYMDSADRTTINLLATGMVLSYEKDWSSLESLVSLAADQSTAFRHKADHQTMHNLMYNYSQHHDCEKTAQFISNLLTACAQKPSRMTCVLLLKSAISDQRLDLLEEWWLEFSNADVNLQCDRTVVWELLSHYREIHDVDIGLITWVSNIIQRYTPWLNSEEGKVESWIAHADKAQRNGKTFHLIDNNKKRILKNIGRKFSMGKHTSASMIESDRIAQRNEPLAIEQNSLAHQSPYKAADHVFISSELLLDISLDNHESEDHTMDLTKTEEVRRRDTKVSTDNSEDHTVGLTKAEKVDSQLKTVISTHSSKKHSIDLTRIGEISRPDTTYSTQSGATKSITQNIHADNTSATNSFDDHDKKEHLSSERSKPIGEVPLRDKMIAAMALGDYSTVIALYCDNIGHASDMVALRMAAQASIRLHDGAPQHAESLLEHGRQHQIATIDAEVAVKIARLRNFQEDGREGAKKVFNELLTELQHSLQAAEEIKEYIFVEAANLLMFLQSPDLADKLIGILDQALFECGKSLSLVAMTVWLRARAGRAHFGSAVRLTKRVLDSGIVIDHKFRKEVWNASVAVSKGDNRDHYRRVQEAKQLAALSEECLARIDKQQQDSSRFAWDLARTIITIADPDNAEASLRDMSETAHSTHLVFRHAKTMKGFSGLDLPETSTQARKTSQHADAQSRPFINPHIECGTVEVGSKLGEEQSDAMHRLIEASRQASLAVPDSASDSDLIDESDTYPAAQKSRIDAYRSEKSRHGSTSRKPMLPSTTRPDIKVQRNDWSTQRKHLDEPRLIETDDITNVLRTDVRQALVSAAG